MSVAEKIERVLVVLVFLVSYVALVLWAVEHTYILTAWLSGSLGFMAGAVMTHRDPEEERE
jgi:hypothetical protein